MNHKNIIYLFRQKNSFKNFIEKYNLELKNFHIKNEELMEYKIFKNLNNNDILDNEIILLSSKASFDYLINNIDFQIIKNKKFLLVGKNLKEYCVDFAENIIFCGNSIFDIKNFLLNSIYYYKEILYLRGEIIKYDLINDNQIKNSSIKINQKIVYGVEYSSLLSYSFLENIKNQKIKSFVFFSSESYKNFIKISEKYNLLDKYFEINIICLGKYLDKNTFFKNYLFTSDNLISSLINLIRSVH